MSEPVEHRPRRVLVIEDNRDMAESLSLFLAMRGDRVEVAYDGSEGLAVARAFEPEVIICDLGLPVLDGFAVARAVRREPGLRSVRLIAFSAYDRRADALAAGFDRFMMKPGSLVLLQRWVDEEPGRVPSARLVEPGASA